MKPASTWMIALCDQRAFSPYPKRNLLFLTAGHQTDLLSTGSLWSLTSSYALSFTSSLSHSEAICSYSLGMKQLPNFPNTISPLVFCIRFFFPLQCRKGTTKPFNTLKKSLSPSTLKAWRQLPKVSYNSMNVYALE